MPHRLFSYCKIEEIWNKIEIWREKKSRKIDHQQQLKIKKTTIVGAAVHLLNDTFFSGF